MALVFTHCDKEDDFGLDYAFDWYQTGIVHDGLGMPEVSKDHIFLFKGKDGLGGQSTQHAEIKTWVKSMIVPEEAARIQRDDYEELVAEALASNNQKMKETFTEIVEMRK